MGITDFIFFLDSTQNPPIFADAPNAIVPRREGLLSMDPDKFKST